MPEPDIHIKDERHRAHEAVRLLRERLTGLWPMDQIHIVTDQQGRTLVRLGTGTASSAEQLLAVLPERALGSSGDDDQATAAVDRAMRPV